MLCHGRWTILVVMLIGSTLGLPYHSPLNVENVDVASSESSASTVEVLRNMQKILSIATRPLENPGKIKVAKQATQNEADQEGAANALAYLTDSFGGQLAGQILSVILSSVTGDVRGILGNSLNLFQTDDRRDRVQFFLDDISHNFLKFTGLGALTTTKPPTGQAASTPLSLILASGPSQLHPVQPQQAFQIASLGPSAGSSGVASSAGLGSFGSTGLGSFGSSGLGGSYGSSGLGGSFGSNSLASAQLLQQKPQQVTAAQTQPIIYVLPPSSVSQTASAGTSASSSTGTVGTKLASTSSTGSRGSSTSTNTADEDSDEDRQLFSNYLD